LSVIALYQIGTFALGVVIMINVKMKVSNFSKYDKCAYCGESHNIMYVYQWSSLFGSVSGDRYCGDKCYTESNQQESV